LQHSKFSKSHHYYMMTTSQCSIKLISNNNSARVTLKKVKLKCDEKLLTEWCWLVDDWCWNWSNDLFVNNWSYMVNWSDNFGCMHCWTCLCDDGVESVDVIGCVVNLGREGRIFGVRMWFGNVLMQNEG